MQILRFYLPLVVAPYIDGCVDFATVISAIILKYQSMNVQIISNVIYLFFICALEGFEIKPRYVNAKQCITYVNKSYQLLFEIYNN